MSSVKFAQTSHIFPGQHIRHYPGSTRNREEDTQYLEVKQYTPIDQPNPQEGDVTILGTCATSFPKEMYEALWDDLLDQCTAKGVRIRAIWAVDKSDHGASGVLNEHTQGDDPGQSDVARDLLHMVNIFRDQITMPIIGIGHSMGATCLLELASIHPRLLASVVAIDPIIGEGIKPVGAFLARSCVSRQDLWTSRQEAEKYFRSAKALKRWDPRVMEAWLRHGLRDTPTLLHPKPGMVTLTTTKATEAWNYLRPSWDSLPEDGKTPTAAGLIKHPDRDASFFQKDLFYQPPLSLIWDRLPRIRSSVLYVIPEQSPVGGPGAAAKKVAETGFGADGSGGEAMGRSKKAMLKGGHLIPFENPGSCATAIAEWMADDLKSWNERRVFEAQNREGKSINKVALSEEYIRQVKTWALPPPEKSKSRL